MTNQGEPGASGGGGRRLLLSTSSGAALGFAVWSLLGPRVVSWWYEPPSKDAFSCAGSVRGALGQFVWMQLICAVLGSVLATVVVLLWRRRQKRKATPTTG